MTEQERLNLIFFYVKLIDACICFPSKSNVDNTLEGINTLDSSIAYQVLKIMMEEKCHFMDNQMKENAHRVLSYFEQHYTSIDRVELIEKTNDLIISINRCDDTEIETMLENELAKRFYNRKDIMKRFPDKERRIAYVKLLIIDDFDTLLSHSKIYSDEDFDKISDNYALENVDYMSSICSIVTEYPQILNNSLFLSRVSIVSEKIKRRKSNKKIYKTFKKIINL